MLPHDFDLTTAHLQALAGRESIVALFAQLGYNTEARLKQTAAALGFVGLTPASLIEGDRCRIAGHRAQMPYR